MRVVKPGRGNSLVRIHHCNNSLPPGPARLPGTEGRDAALPVLSGPRLGPEAGRLTRCHCGLQGLPGPALAVPVI